MTGSMSVNHSNHSPFYLGGLYIEPAKNLVHYSNRARHIQPKLMEVLVFLCSRQGQVVSADALIEACWPNQFISDSPIHKCIAQLRKILGDTSKDAVYIKTISRKGYMVVAEVVGIENASDKIAPYWTNRTPYPGSKPFQMEDQAIFFGREKAVKDITDWASDPDKQQGHWLSICGEPACGKTSFIQAGILPKLLKVPSLHGKVFSGHIKLDLSENIDKPAYEKLLALLCERQESCSADMLGLGKSLLSGLPTGNTTQDQIDTYFQEIFTSQPGSSQYILFLDHLDTVILSSIQDEIVKFFAIVSALLSSQKCLLITATQSHFLARLETVCPDHYEAFQYEFPTFSNSEIIEIIQKPAAAANLTFDYDKENRERLDTFIIHQQHIMPAPIAALQQLLAHLYSGRNNRLLTYVAYEDIGGIGGCLSLRAEEVFQSLSEKAKAIFSNLLFKFISLNAAGDTVAIAEPIIEEIFTGAATIECTSALIEAGILCISIHNQRIFFALSHKSLLTQWPRIVNWIEENTSNLYKHHDMKVGTERWLQHNKNNAFLMQATETLKFSNGILQTNIFPVKDMEREFVSQSLKRASFKNKAKYSIAALFAIFAISLATLTISIQQKNNQLQQSQSNAENLISVILYDLKDKLEPLGKLELLDIVGAKAKEYFEAAGTDNLSSKSLIQWVEALNILGQVNVDKKNFKEAQAYFTQSQKALNAAFKHDANNPALLEQAMLTSYWQGYIPFKQRQYGTTLGYWKNYLVIAEKLLTLQPENKNWLLEKSYALNNLGSVSEKTNQLKQAQIYFSQSADIKRALLKISPTDNTIRAEFADTLSWQGSLQKRKGRLSSALTYYQDALSQVGLLYTAQPQNYAWIQESSRIEHRVAQLYFDTGHMVEALAHEEQSHDKVRQLIVNDPKSYYLKEQLLTSNLLLIQIFRNQKKNDQSLLHINIALEIITEFTASKYTPRIREIHIMLLHEQAKLFHSIGQYRAAIFTIERTLLLIDENTQHQNDSRHLVPQLMLTKFHIYETAAEPLGQGFLDEFNDTRESLLSLISEGQFSHISTAIYLKMLNATGQTLKNKALLSAYLSSEYRNPDFIVKDRDINHKITEAPPKKD